MCGNPNSTAMSIIEENTQAQRELQQLVDAVPQHIVVLSRDGKRLYGNQAACEYYGLSPQQFLVEPITNCFHLDDIENYSRLRNAGISKGEPWEAEARLRRKDGAYRWFLIRFNPLRDEQGQIVRWYATGTDIEERKHAEREIQQLVDAVPHFVSVLSGDGRRLYINKVGLDFFGWGPQDYVHDNSFTHCHPEDLAGFLEHRQRGISSGNPFELEARLLRKDGQYRWFLLLYNPYRNEQGQIVRWYATATDIEDRKQAEREIQQLVDAVPQHLSVLAADGRRLYANKVLLDYHGGTLEEWRENTVGKRVHPDDLTRFLETRKRGISDGVPFQSEVRLRAKNGQYRWLLLLYNPLRDENGHVVRWYATGTDIEDRKQAENALRRNAEQLAIQKAQLDELFELSPEGVVLLDVEDRILRINPEFTRIFGYTPEEAIGRFIDDLVVPEELRSDAEGYTQWRIHGKPVNAETIRRRKDGKRIHVSLLGVPVTVPDGGKIAEYVIYRDISERIQAEEALRRSETYLAEAQRLSHTGSWAWDYNRKEINFWSPETYRAFGFDPSGGAVSWQEARSRIHPEDLRAFDQNKERVANEKAELEFDFRLVHSDGSIRHAHCVSRPVLNASGEVIELVGSLMDVTEQHQAKTTLEAAFQEIKRLKDDLYRENLVLKEEIDKASMFEEIVGASDALRRVLVQVAKVAPTDSTVLLIGETGTGKELVARAIHKRSQRASKTFVSVNCAAIPAGLIASELFGHEKGAFTGATQRHLGRFELAGGGTLFLDEVGDLSSETQVALLRVLQERRLERVGGTQSITVDVRIIAATNRDLKAAVSSGAFRSDLFYRLNVFPILIPPLRDRKDDLPLLVEYLTERYASKAGKKIKKVQKRTLELFQAYDWPGNIRELQNIIERAVILCDGETLSVDESWLQWESIPRTDGGGRLARLGPEQERKLIEAALAESRGRIGGPSGAAAKLGIPRSTLESKIRKLGIPKYRFKSA